jgi:hypothetical protein
MDDLANGDGTFAASRIFAYKVVETEGPNASIDYDTAEKTAYYAFVTVTNDPAAGTPAGARSTGRISWGPTHLPGTEQVRAGGRNSHTHMSHPTLSLTSSLMPVRLRAWVRAESSPRARWLAMCLRLKSSLRALIRDSVRCRVSAELLTGLGTIRADMLARRSASADRLWAWRMVS